MEKPRKVFPTPNSSNAIGAYKKPLSPKTAA